MANSTMSKFDETYIATVAAVPAYWLIVMLPYAVGLFLGRPKEEPFPEEAELPEREASRAALARRCVAAHRNSWEGFTIYLAAMIAGFSAKADCEVLNAASLVMVCARLLLVVLYLAVESGPLSFARSFMFFVHMCGAGVAWTSAIHSASGGWDDSYIMIAIAAPIYWVLVMLPALMRIPYLRQPEQSAAQVNSEPRKAIEDLANSDSPVAGFVRRATAAHENGWENYALFFISAGVAAAAGGNHTFVNSIVVVHLVVRALFVTVYLLDKPIRGLIFNLGNVTCIILWVIAIYKTGSSGYVAASAATPLTWWFLMLPYLVRLYILTSGESGKDLKTILPDPRKATADFGKSEDPRAGLLRRAQAAHVNGWENLAMIGSAIIVSLAAEADATLVNASCIAFVVARALYVIAYLVDAFLPRVFFYIVGVAAAAVMWVAAINEL